MNLAPIALFVYKRPEHTRKVLDTLTKNELAKDSELYIFSDAPKTPAASNEVTQVRKLLQQIAGFKSVTIIERSDNYGLAKSIITGVTDILKSYENVIVLEDDLLTSPYFLTYMNEALQLYKNEPQVISIHGYTYPLDKDVAQNFFLRGADCWGWATWKRGWDLFEPDGSKLLRQLQQQGLANAFDFDGTFPYMKMLRDQIAGKNDSWAIRWNASAFLANKLTLYPRQSYVQNIGNDNSGTHSEKSELFKVTVSDIFPNFDGIIIQEDVLARELFKQFFKKTLQPKNVMQKIRRLLFNK